MAPTQKISSNYWQIIFAVLTVAIGFVSWAIGGNFAKESEAADLRAKVSAHDEVLRANDARVRGIEETNAHMATQIDDIHKLLIEGRGR